MTKAVNHQTLQAHYQGLADHYDTRWQAFNDLAHQWVLGNLDPPRAVLDLGCGTGRLLSLIHDRYPEAQLAGVDGSSAMLAHASDRLEAADWSVANLETMNPPDRACDTVLSINVLHHLNDPEKHLNLMKECCSETGTVYLTDFAISTAPMKLAELWWENFHPAHHRAFSYRDLKKMIARHFTIETSTLLRLDAFWKIQAYKLRNLQPNNPRF